MSKTVEQGQAEAERNLILMYNDARKEIARLRYLISRTVEGDVLEEVLQIANEEYEAEAAE